MMYLELLIGLVILVGAAEVMIRGAVGLARIFGLSPMLIGMTVIALGTSAPELVVSLDAALSGNPGIATGNVVGSNIANILLIVGAAAILMPMVRRQDRLNRDALLLVLCTALFIMLCWTEQLDWPHGLLLFAVFAAFMGVAYWRDTHDPKASAERAGEVEDHAQVVALTHARANARHGGVIQLQIGQIGLHRKGRLWQVQGVFVISHVVLVFLEYYFRSAKNCFAASRSKAICCFKASSEAKRTSSRNLCKKTTST